MDRCILLLKAVLYVLAGKSDELELLQFRGRQTRPNIGAEAAHEIEQEASTS